MIFSIADPNQSVEYGDSEEGYEPNPRRDAEWHAAQHQRKDTSTGSHRDAEEDQCCQRTERNVVCSKRNMTNSTMGVIKSSR